MLVNRKLFVAGVICLSFLPAIAFAGVLGVWSTVDDESHVKIEPCGDKICGTITWLKEPDNPEGKPKLDKNNTDDSLRTRPILGLQLLKDFETSSETKWDDGTIYNPEDGKTYSSTMTLSKPDVLDVEGCVMIFCKTQVWNRVK